MTSALVGYTGFVGSALRRQRTYDALYNSANIDSIAGQNYDLLICAGAPAEKWKANQQPEADRANLARLMNNLRQCTAARVVLISTVDVYPQCNGVDEHTAIDRSRLGAYGLHRRELEDFVAATFPRSHILRLPGLFGQGLKKNFLFDLLTRGASEWTHRDSRFQFYDIDRLADDVDTVTSANLPLVNLATEPVVAGDVAWQSFGIEYRLETAAPPVAYDLRTVHATAFGGRNGYLYDAAETFRRIAAFFEQQRHARPV